jgi:phosphoglycolate phosphatase
VIEAPAHPLSKRSLQGVLFDLDGTLLDTVADISVALNRALNEQGLTSLPSADVRAMIGHGVPTLIERTVTRHAAGGELTDAALLLERFNFHYERLHERGEIQTRAYPDVAEGLAQLNAIGLNLAVVTNKPQQPAADLLARLGLTRWIDVLVAGDTGLARKPHPEPLLYACNQLEVPPARALMVGDSMTDVLAARAAGLAIVCVPYGYNEGADAHALPCDAFVESIADLPALLTAMDCLSDAAPPLD